MDAYYELKKKQGYIFTLHDIAPKFPYDSIDKKTGRPIEMPEGASYWSRLSGRYRDAEEQRAFIDSGLVDKRLPPRRMNA